MIKKDDITRVFGSMERGYQHGDKYHQSLGKQLEESPTWPRKNELSEEEREAIWQTIKDQDAESVVKKVIERMEQMERKLGRERQDDIHHIKNHLHLMGWFLQKIEMYSYSGTVEEAQKNYEKDVENLIQTIAQFKINI